MPLHPPTAVTRHALLWWLLVSAVHVYILSAGFVWPLPSYSAYYSRQADAFARGQTYLILKPPTGLLALPDPYDPDANRPFRRGVGVHDAVLFDGKLYHYWGPLPALLLVPVKAVLARGGPVVVGDEWLVLAFALGTTLWVALILRHLALRHFPTRSPTVVFVGTAVFGLSTPTTYFLARPAVYEAAIAGGQFFLLAGLLAIVRAVDARPNTTERQRPPSPIVLMIAGTCLAGAVACRVSLAVAVTAVAAMVMVRLLLHGKDEVGRMKDEADPAVGRFVSPLRLHPSSLPCVVAFALPLVATALTLVAFNQARFGKPFEFGQRYQLTGANYRAVPALFSAANVVPSAWSYLARPMVVSNTFPFVHPQVGPGTFPGWITLPPNYETHEAIAGLLPTVPLFVLGLLPLLRLVTCRRHEPRGLLHAVGLLAVGGVVTFAPAVFMIGTTHRYLMDAWPCWAVLTTVGVWQWTDRGGRGAVRRAVVAALIAWGVGVGVFTGHSGYYDHFRTWNRPLFEGLGGVVER